jgi:hypothetical protein
MVAYHVEHLCSLFAPEIRWKNQIPLRVVGNPLFFIFV